ncbi:MAG: hypothetical protein ACREXR_01910 [Gammaproteobacteria bacterium]
MISSDEFRALAEHQKEGPHVSLFMPTARAGAEIQQSPIRFKNLIREVESRLEAQQMRKPEIEALLNPAQECLQITASGSTKPIDSPFSLPGSSRNTFVFRSDLRNWP